jgi:hypothetical protein
VKKNSTQFCQRRTGSSYRLGSCQPFFVCLPRMVTGRFEGVQYRSGKTTHWRRR